MEYKSNITIASNIYRRSHTDAAFDQNFARNCRGGTALRILRENLFEGPPIYESREGGRQLNAELSIPQKNELKAHTFCPRFGDRVRTHGIVKRGRELMWVCRCEVDTCDQFSVCKPEKISREPRVQFETEALEIYDLEFEWLGSKTTVDELFIEPEIDTDEDYEVIPPEFSEPPKDKEGEYTEIPNPSEIIDADIDSQIAVNAGPGTGKTFTVIERLAHLIQSGDVELGQVLVLCYTRAAKSVIMQRLSDKGLGEQAQQLVICTLDSLAWQNLVYKLSDNNRIASLFDSDYDECIEKFNTLFGAEEWSDFEYVIIDELQDIVNGRARMVLNILDAVSCGCLLLGDKCQAIYDYECDDNESVNSEDFYRLIDELLPDDTCRYELIGNKRQTSELLKFSDKLRRILLEFWGNARETNKRFCDILENIESISFSPSLFADLSSSEKTAILTRTNGEAEWVSAQLHKKGIPHTLLRAINQQTPLHRWIADIFWDYREPRISRDEFIERYLVRVDGSNNLAARSFDVLLLLQPEKLHSYGYIDMAELRKSLRRAENFSHILQCGQHDTLTVSTIHKSKGREYDNVYMFSDFNFSSENTNEARVFYVGVTRAKSRLSFMHKKKWWLRKPITARWILQGATWKSTFCDRIVVGIIDDISQNSFVEGTLEQAVRIQSYIANQVSINDKVDIYLVNNTYQVYHKGTCIGSLSDSALENIYISVKNLYWWSDIPPHLADVYVNNIITIMPHSFPSGADAMFKNPDMSNYWLGVEITGFAKVDWRWDGDIK